jgi:hypothetical protein
MQIHANANGAPRGLYSAAALLKALNFSDNENKRARMKRRIKGLRCEDNRRYALRTTPPHTVWPVRLNLGGRGCLCTFAFADSNIHYLCAAAGGKWGACEWEKEHEAGWTLKLWVWQGEKIYGRTNIPPESCWKWQNCMHKNKMKLQQTTTSCQPACFPTELLAR